MTAYITTSTKKGSLLNNVREYGSSLRYTFICDRGNLTKNCLLYHRPPLTEKVLAENPAISSVTVDLDVLPANQLPYDRSSTVTRTINGKLAEAWDFKIPNYSIAYQGLNNLNIDLKYQYKPGITQAEYPHFVPIYKNIDNFLVDYPNETDFWDIVNKNLTQKVLAQNRLWIRWKLVSRFCRLTDCPTNELVLCRWLSV